MDPLRPRQPTKSKDGVKAPRTVSSKPGQQQPRTESSPSEPDTSRAQALTLTDKPALKNFPPAVSGPNKKTQQRSPAPTGPGSAAPTRSTTKVTKSRDTLTPRSHPSTSGSLKSLGRKAESLELQGSESEKVQAWETFVQHEAVLHTKRIQADEYRRRTANKRKAVAKLFKAHAALLLASTQELAGSQSEEIARNMSLVVSEQAQLEQMDCELDKLEGEIMDLESRIARFLPRIENPNVDIVFENLLNSNVRSRTSQSSGDSRVMSSDDDGPVLPDQKRYEAKLTAYETLRDQLRELELDERRFRHLDAALQDEQSLKFLRNFPTDHERLEDELTWAEDELRQLIDALRPFHIPPHDSTRSPGRETQIYLEPG